MKQINSKLANRIQNEFPDLYLVERYDLVDFRNPLEVMDLIYKDAQIWLEISSASGFNGHNFYVEFRKDDVDNVVRESNYELKPFYARSLQDAYLNGVLAILKHYYNIY